MSAIVCLSPPPTPNGWQRAFPTPVATDSWSESLDLRKCKGWENGRGWTLGQVARRFPTPVASDSARGSLTYMRGNPTLLGAARKYPTPKASASHYGRPRENDRGDLQAAVATEESGSLNPLWVEWLMGFPPGWTDCEVSETPSCQKWHEASALDSLNGGGSE